MDMSNLEHKNYVHVYASIAGHYSLALTNVELDQEDTKIDVSFSGYDESKLQLKHAGLKAGDIYINPDLYILEIDNMIGSVSVTLNVSNLDPKLLGMLHILNLTVWIDEI